MGKEFFRNTLQDMKELKEHNLEKLSEYFNDYRDAFKRRYN